MAGVLDGIRVLELAVAHQGPQAATMLGDLGAEVIKIEERGVGDPSRSLVRSLGVPMRHPSGRNFNFENTNRNKKGIAVDLKKPEGREVVYRLVERADVFLSNYRRDVLQRLGVDYPTLKEHNTRLIYAHASGYGPLGPEAHTPGQDFPGQARSGIMMWEVDSPEDEPYSPMGIGDQIGAMTTAYGVIAALLARERLGIGQEVNTSLLGGMIALQTIPLGALSLSGQQYRPWSQSTAPVPLLNVYRTADGKWLALGMQARADRFWSAFCHAMSMEELEHDPRFATREIREEHAPELIPILNRAFAQKTRDEWLRILKDYDVVAGPVNSPREVLEDPQALLNEYIVDYNHPVLGPVKFVGCPVRFERTPARIERPAPLLGEHTEEVLRQVAGYNERELQRLKEIEVI